jgi:hypothetical protein
MEQNTGGSHGRGLLEVHMPYVMLIEPLENEFAKAIMD